ncbi:MAG: branched-chain amino acid ABC transporter substrate-binding protein [Actinobacteria bacterium]|nr:branched-chain amino acid ABC transporter substrate-binding protein [Actinomycetota bacterium]
MFKWKRAIALLVALMMVLTLAAGCGGKTENKADTKKEEPKGAQGDAKLIKIATVSPLSGDQSAMGEGIMYGGQMALEERKAAFEALGFKLELAPQDDQADPKVGVAVAQKIIADPNILGVVGHLNSNVAIPSSEVYAKDNLVMVSPANTNPAVTDRGLASVNRVCGRDDVQGPAGAKFAFEKLGVKSIFVVHDKTTYGQGLADEFKKAAEGLGVKVVGYEAISKDDVDYTAVLNQAKPKNPDLIYFGGMYPQGGLLLKQAREKGIKAKFMGGDGLDDGQIVKVAGANNLVDSYYTSAAGPLPDSAKDWAAKYKGKFKKDPSAYAAYAYDSMNVILNTMEKLIKEGGNKKPSRADISKAVRATKDFKGIVTNVTFDSKGDNAFAAIFIFKFKGGDKPYPGELIGKVSK